MNDIIDNGRTNERTNEPNKNQTAEGDIPNDFAMNLTKTNINNKLKLTSWFVGVGWRLWDNISFVWFALRLPASEVFSAILKHNKQTDGKK